MTSPVEDGLHREISAWFDRHARSLPWRARDCSAWGVLVSEVMLQQTPVIRVEPVWREWMQRWPQPADLAASTSGEAVRAWGRLGYPRRAIRLHEAAQVITQEHGGNVPRDPIQLRALPGVGEYTTAAVQAFAFGDRATVVDTNVRRVLVRTIEGEALPALALNRTERELAESALPTGRDASARWNAAVMELGALVCTARSPHCARCPIQQRCAWQKAGYPPYSGPPRKGQKWAGTDRQCRGALLHVLRGSPEPVAHDRLALAWSAEMQRERCLDSLIVDRLVEPIGEQHFQLPQ